MPQARCTELRDALAAFIDVAWAEEYPDRAADDEVIAKTRLDFTMEPDRPQDYITGRKVCVFAGPYQGSPADRGEDADDYSLTVWVVEYFRDKGDVTGEWLDPRYRFVEWLYRKVRNPRTVQLLGSAWPQEWGEVIPVDPDRIASYKQFWSSFEITFREHREADTEAAPSSNQLLWGNTPLTWVG